MCFVSAVPGYRVYGDVEQPLIGEELNDSMLKGNGTVRHLPRKLISQFVHEVERSLSNLWAPDVFSSKTKINDFKRSNMKGKIHDPQLMH